MDQRSEGDQFRAGATSAYRFACAALPLLVPLAGWLGWHFGGWVGLIIAGGIGLVIAGVGWFAAAFVYAMTQDGA